MDAPFAVTLDFHDTLFQCDEWFALEVEGLVPAILDWLHRAGRLKMPTSEQQQAARLAYRQLRRQIIASGIEQDAVECVLRVCADLGLDVRRSEVEAGVDALMRATLSSAQPRPGAAELVAELRRAGTRLGVISNAVHHPFLEWALAAHGLADCFDVIVSSASVGYYKSRPEIFQLTLRSLDVPADRAVHIGDSYRFDVLGASAAGMRTVWLASDTPVEGEGERADLTVTTLAGLAPQVLALLAEAG